MDTKNNLIVAQFSRIDVWNENSFEKEDMFSTTEYL